MAPSSTRKEMPPRDSATVAVRGADQVRSRKETLSSPIPALLATSMGDVEEGPVDAESIPVFVNGGETSRLDASVRQALLAERPEAEPGEIPEEADEDAYLVEIDPVIR